LTIAYNVGGLWQYRYLITKSKIDMIHLIIHEDSSSIKYKSLVAFLHNEKIVFEQSPVLPQAIVSGRSEQLPLADVEEMYSKAHSELAKSAIPMEQYSIISRALIEAKQRLYGVL
jgi:hypothetical protein